MAGRVPLALKTVPLNAGDEKYVEQEGEGGFRDGEVVGEQHERELCLGGEIEPKVRVKGPLSFQARTGWGPVLVWLGRLGVGLGHGTGKGSGMIWVWV